MKKMHLRYRDGPLPFAIRCDHIRLIMVLIRVTIISTMHGISIITVDFVLPIAEWRRDA